MNYYIADATEVSRIDMCKSSFEEARQSKILMYKGEWRSIRDIHEGNNDDVQIELFGRWYEEDTSSFIAKVGETLDKVRVTA